VRANSHKSYLADLGRRGVAVVPTTYLPRGSRASLAAILGERGWTDVVVKPAVSASAYRTSRVRREVTPADEAGFADVLAQGDVLVQPYLPEIAVAGEWSFVFLGGAFSHAVRKLPRPGDYRVQDEHGGRAFTETPSPALLAQAERIAAAIPRPWLYARVDAVETRGALVLMELELIEPALFLAQDPAAPGRFAEAIRRAGDGRRVPA
jgi:glutathione synthase/RimK-type ligase-like ATP-grasp enzyme